MAKDKRLEIRCTEELKNTLLEQLNKPKYKLRNYTVPLWVEEAIAEKIEREKSQL